MKRLLIVIICLFLTRGTYAYCYDSIAERRLLKQLVESGQDQDKKLNAIVRLVDFTRGDATKREQYVDMLFDEAQKSNNPKYMCKAYLYHIIMAYNMYDIDAVKEWMQLLEPLSLKHKYYDLYFRGKKAELDMMLINSDFELQEKAATEMLAYATKLNDPTGLSCAYQTLGNTYISTFRYSKAVEMLEKAYKVSSEQKDHIMVDEITSRLIDIFAYTKDRVNQLKYIKLADNNIANAIAANPNEESSSFRYSLLMVNVNYLNYYRVMNDLDKAAQYLQEAEKYYDSEAYLYDLYYRIALYDYYHTSGQYDKAIEQIDYLINKPETEDIIRNEMYFNKAEILAKAERYTDALNIYKALRPRRDSIQKSIIAKQIESLREDYNSGMLLLEKEQIKRNAGLSIILLIIVITGTFAWFMLKSYRIRKRLKSDELEILRMNQEVYNINVAKDKFLSNIKAAICVPLNKVVADSLLLASPDDQLSTENRKKISVKINSTSAELMQLINNILDLSRMEAGMMKFSIEANNVFLLLCEVVVEMELRGVKIGMNVSEDNDSCLEIDVAKFRSVLHTMASREQNSSVEMEFSIIDNGQMLQIKVYGSKLALADQSQDIIITNEINRMLVESFKGNYTIIHPTEIVITLPTSRPQASSTN